MKMIWVTFRKSGQHFYPLAGTQGLEDVDYLRYPHRHLFHFKIAVQVFHDDRELEFHQLLNFLDSNVTCKKLNNKSCEMIADDIATLLAEKYTNKEGDKARRCEIEVAEDGECGVVAQYMLAEGKWS